MFVATVRNAWFHWNEIGRQIQLQDQGAKLVRYLGAIYRFDEYNPEVPAHPRSIATETSGYLRNLLQRFLKNPQPRAPSEGQDAFPDGNA